MGLFGGDSISTSTGPTIKRTEYVDSLNTTISHVSNLNESGNINVGSLAGLSPALGNPLGDLLSSLGLGAVEQTDESASPFEKYKTLFMLAGIALVAWLIFKGK